MTLASTRVFGPPLALVLTAALASCERRAHGGAVYTPERDDTVLADVPRRPPDDPARALEARVRANPLDMEAALALARVYIEEARRRSDPRMMGRAEALLAPLIAAHTASTAPELFVMRATILQNRHEFPAARADLDAVLEARPTSAQAWVTRAVIATVQGDYAEAERSCSPLVRLSTTLVAATCIAAVAAMTGHLEPAYAALERELAGASSATVGERLWAISTLAELAARRGDDAAAELWFTQGLSLGERDVYLLAARADHLLDRGRFAEALALLANEDQDDGLLLRRVLAEKATGDARFAEHDRALSSRYAASRQRGESVHAREESRYLLAVRGDPQAALARALEAWSTQKESADARVVLEAALAARDRAAAEPVITFLRKHRTEDRTLTALLTKLEATR